MSGRAIVIFIVLLVIINPFSLHKCDTLQKKAKLRRILKSIGKWCRITLIGSAMFTVLAGVLFDWRADSQSTVVIYVIVCSMLIEVCLMLYSNVCISVIDRELRESGMASRKEFMINTLKPKTYEPDSHIPESIVRASGFYPRWKDIQGSDFVVCAYRGVSLSFSDLLLTHQEFRTDHSVTVTDFKGTFIVLECDRKLECALRIQEEIPLFYTEIQTGNQEFDDRYHAFSYAPQEAMGILTHQFVERFMEADAHADAVSSMLIKENRIYIMLENKKDLFEFGDAVTFEEYYNACRRELEGILRYVDILIEAPELFDQSRVAPKEAQG